MDARLAVTTGPDRVLPATRVLCAFIIPFLLVAFGLLYFWPSADDTGRLFAWRIAPEFTSTTLASAYLGGAYFFARGLVEQRWHRIAGGFLPVALFSGLLGVATVLHWDRFVHGNLSFWLWAGLYFTAPLLVLAVWLANRRVAVDLPGADEVLLSTPEVGLIATAGGLAGLIGLFLFAFPGAAAAIWPWSLTPLTARVVGAIFALGFAGVQVLADRRWSSARIMVQVGIIMLGLMLVAAVRTPADFAVDRPLTWVMAVGFPAAFAGLVGLSVRPRGRPRTGA